VTRTSPAQVNFAGGEIDPLLAQRTDFARQQTGLARMNGFLPLIQGPVTRMPGTFHLGSTRGDQAAVLLPFTFAADDAVLLEFTDLCMRVWRYSELVTVAGLPYELVTPFPAASLSRLQWAQSADVIYLCDGLRPVQRLERRALDNWVIGAAQFDTGPFRVQNLDPTLTIQASAMAGTVTLTASAAFWTSAQIGSLILLQPTDATVPYWTAGEAVGASGVAVGDYRRYDGRIYQLAAASATTIGPNPPIHDAGTALSDKWTNWRYVSDEKGIARITAVASPTVATATVLRTIHKACVDAPTSRWSEGAWSDKYGYPATVEIFQQRAVYAGTPSEPRSLWFSTVGDYRDFLPSTEADGAFTYTIAGEGTINAIQSLKRGRSGLHVFGLGEEWSTRADTSAAVIGPTNAVISQDGSNGARPARPIAPFGDPIFISRDGRRVLQIGYSLQDDAKRITNLTLPAGHLGAVPFTALAWQAQPLPIIWAIREDGTLAALIHDPGESVLGWSTLSLAGGVVESLAVSPSATIINDNAFVVVRRTVNGVTRRFVERMAQIWTALSDDVHKSRINHLYAAKRFAPDPAANRFDMSHLTGRQVYALTNLGHYGPITIPTTGPDAGFVVLPDAVDWANIGLFDATHLIETFDIPAATAEGSSLGRQKRILSGLAIGVHRTMQGYVRMIERDFGRPERITDPEPILPDPVITEPVPILTGLNKLVFPSGAAMSVAIRITPDRGAPLTITAIVPTVSEGGR